jgi:hypothetical protein
MTEERIAVIVVSPGADPVVEQIAPTVEGMQEIVGGYFELVRLVLAGVHVDLWCNEDARRQGLPLNRRVPGVDDIRGTFFVTVHAGEDVVGLPPALAAQLLPVIAGWTRYPIARNPDRA